MEQEKDTTTQIQTPQEVLADLKSIITPEEIQNLEILMSLKSQMDIINFWDHYKKNSDKSQNVIFKANRMNRHLFCS